VAGEVWLIGFALGNTAPVMESVGEVWLDILSVCFHTPSSQIPKPTPNFSLSF
jgi:hypothetical protein